MTKKEPSRAIRLFGTDEEVAPPRLLKAGHLTAEFEAGNLRYIRYDGIEMIRAVAFIVRDKNWATYTPALSNLKIAEDRDRFTVTYDAVTKDAAQELRYSAEIEGHADGRLIFAATGEAASDFLTNRTGFAVLHPIAGVAGKPATVEEVDGKIVETRFPDLISPGQPIFNMRAIAHEFAPGAKIVCRMEGDKYEMEDQRNWMDASYKTYVRSLRDPWPYTLKAGAKFEQKVSLSIEGRPASRSAGAQSVAIRLGKELGKVPALGVGLAPEDAAEALATADRLRELRLAHLICHHDRRAGHDSRTLEQMLAVAKAIGAEPWLEAVVAKVDGFEDEIAQLGKIAADLGSPFAAVMLSPASDMKSTQPDGPWPPCPPLADVYKLARRHFPEARIGGGMMSYFTEINRKRPPAELTDFVTFTTSSLVHAGDDRSVTEGLEALPAMARSVRAFIGGKPFAVGPSAIGMRFNPYGAAPVANPKDIRQAMNGNDPRQRGLINAAWSLGYFAHCAYGGAEAVALGGLTGAFGVLHSKADWPQEWFDQHGGLYPVFHVMRGVGGLAKASLRALDIGAPRDVQGLAVTRDGRHEVWLANLTGEKIAVDLDPVMKGARFAALSPENFVAATEKAGLLDALDRTLASPKAELDAYSVTRIGA